MPHTTPAALLGAALLVATFAVAVPPTPTTTGTNRPSPVAFQVMRDGSGAVLKAESAPAEPAPVESAGSEPARAEPAPAGPAASGPAASGPAFGIPPAAAASSGPATAPTAGFRWPLEGRPVIGRRFTVGPQPWSPGHRGVDLVAEAGAPVLAPGPGTVRFAGTVVSRGVLTLDHGSGLLTSYEPVRSAVATGARVTPGQTIGWVTPTGGHCPVSCLHWGARRDGVYIDPLTLLAAWRGPPILLPVPDAGP